MLAVAILAAGKGTRMKSDSPKVLHELAGKTLLDWVLNSCRKLKVDKYYVVVGHKAEQVKNSLAAVKNIQFAEQNRQLGTGHAVQQLIPLLGNFTGDLLVLNGDVPLLSPHTIDKLITKHVHLKSDATIITSQLEDPKGYGRVFVNKEGKVTEIVEDKDCNTSQLNNKLTNSGVYIFKWNLLKENLSRISNKNSQGELYLTDVLKDFTEAYHIEVEDSDEVRGVNDKAQLAFCEKILQQRLKLDWMSRGVTFVQPESCTVSPDCELGEGIIIEPQTHIRGKCTFGNKCKLGPSTTITNSSIGNDVIVTYSVVVESKLDNNITIGPYSHLRAGTNIMTNSKIGNFVETKKCEIGESTKINHLSYIGDSKLGNYVNIGAGTITANFDGINKHRTLINDYTKTGANTVLVAPITIGKNVTIGAGSVLTKNVTDNTLAISRSKQIMKENWKS